MPVRVGHAPDFGGSVLSHPIEPPPDKGSRVPEGLMVKCPGCSQILYNKDLAANLSVCPKCTHHFRISASERLRGLFDGCRRLRRFLSEPVDIRVAVVDGRARSCGGGSLAAVDAAAEGVSSSPPPQAPRKAARPTAHSR